MSVNRLVTSRIKKFLLIQEINRIINEQKILLNNENDNLKHQCYLWGNGGWSGLSAYFQSCLQHAKNAFGYIIECRSVLSTILMRVVEKPKGVKLVFLGNSIKWKKRTNWYHKLLYLSGGFFLFKPTTGIRIPFNNPT